MVENLVALSANLRRNTLVLGGARSGKSKYAESLFEGCKKALYVATASSFDNDLEMLERIRIHKNRRGKLWKTIEEPLNITDVISDNKSFDRPILVDCLTIWVSNLMYFKLSIEKEVEKLTGLIERTPGGVIFVSSEVGFGIVPLEAISREFRDNMGYVNQAVANSCERVVLVVAGLKLVMKGE